MSQDDQISIRCPQCGQKFSVGDELRGRLVECGACENRFRVNDLVTVKSRKAYPGEKGPSGYQQFGKQPHLEFSKPAVPSVQYASAPQVERVEPTPMSKIMAAILGGLGFTIATLLLIMGASKNGMLDGVTTDKRMILAGFFALISSALIIYGNVKTRKLAVLACVIASLGLLSLPMFFNEASVAVPKNIMPAEAALTELQKAEIKKTESLKKLRDEVGYEPVERAKSKSAHPEQIIGVWLKGIKDENTLLVADHLTRISASDVDESHLFPRQSGNYLHVLVESQLSFEKLISECDKLGRVDITDATAGLISVIVNNAKFEPVSDDKLNNVNEGAFYQLNLGELQSVDPERIKQALKRLAQAPPVQSRADMTERMLMLVPSADYDMLSDLSAALKQWGTGGDKAIHILLKRAKEVYEDRKTLPENTASLLVAWKAEQFYPLLSELWLERPVSWEAIYSKADTSAESYVAEHLDKGKILTRISAARIIARIGTSKSINQLQKLASEAQDMELKNNYENAIRAIQARN